MGNIALGFFNAENAPTEGADTEFASGSKPLDQNAMPESGDLSPLRPGAGGNLNNDRPANWIVAEEDCARRTAEFRKGQP